MHELDFLPVGDGENSGDAIAFRVTHPTTGTWIYGVVDAGYEDDGDALVYHVKKYYGTDRLDVLILTHPDGDHIGGMGRVIRGLEVKQLWLHNIAAHGGSTLPAAKAVNDLIATAQQHGVVVYEVFAGHSDFGGAVRILGPSKAYYKQLVTEQVQQGKAASTVSKSLIEAARNLMDRMTYALGIETRFEAKDVSPRNNSSMITLIRDDDQLMLLTADAGVPALEQAWDLAESDGIAATPVATQIPHHGSRRNASSAWLDRLLGGVGQPECRSAFVSVVAKSPKHPSGSVVNAYKRRGCKVIDTAGQTVYHRAGVPMRNGWGPAEGLGPMVEEDD